MRLAGSILFVALASTTAAHQDDEVLLQLGLDSDASRNSSKAHPVKEARKEVAEELKKKHLNQTVREVLSLVEPDERGCRCTIERWGQYAMCSEAMTLARTAWSFVAFGLPRGPDAWVAKVRHMTKGRLVPQAVSCFHAGKQTVGYPGHCDVSDKGGQRAEALHTLAAGSSQASMGKSQPNTALVKMDVARSEFQALARLRAEDLQGVGNLNVEFHFSEDCGHDPGEEIKIAQPALKNLQDNFVIIDAKVTYFAEGKCAVKGKEVRPKKLTVSYVGRANC